MADSRAHDHRRRFLELALRVQALRFGEFTLKSGRQSPYFFNAGRFDSGPALATIGAAGGEVAAIAIALDRQEAVSGDDPRSATQALAADAGIAVVAVATLDDLLAFAGESADLVAQREPLLAYRARYGCRTGAAT